MTMVAKLVVITVAVAGMAIVNIGAETLLQMQLAVNLGVLALVVEHRGRISTLETVIDTKHPDTKE